MAANSLSGLKAHKTSHNSTPSDLDISVHKSSLLGRAYVNHSLLKSKIRDENFVKNPFEDFKEFCLPENDDTIRKKRCGFCKHLWTTYDNAVLALICLNYFNVGATQMILMIIVTMYQTTF